MTELAERLQQIRETIAQAATRAGRTPEQVRLVAASKRQPVEAIRQLAGLGVCDFGESQMQEALDKQQQLASCEFDWHFIGHLQSNKTRFVPEHFSWVHTVDSERLARRIAAAANPRARPVKLLLQVNVAADPAKHGIEPGELYAIIDTLLGEQLAGIELKGLMTIGRRDVDEATTRRGFSDLRRLLAGCRERFGEDFTELSMGMSGDFAWAIEEGATLVRVGTVLFGERAPNQGLSDKY